MKKFIGSCLLLLATNVMAIEIESMDSKDRVPGRYLVWMKQPANLRSTFRTMDEHGAKVVHSYPTVLPNVLAVQADEDALWQLQNDPNVLRIKADKIYRINVVQPTNANGLDRIDSRTGRDGNYTFTKTGKGVHAYIIDTGIRSTHKEFVGRLGEGFDAVQDGRGTEDCNGHGSHVAGTVGGSTFGVAKEVILHPVRVLNCRGSGNLSNVLAGINFVAENAIKPAVANMSLGGGRDEDLDNAVNAAIQNGVSFAVAAGNEAQDACNVSPAGVPNAVTVAASNAADDGRAGFSNFGSCVDIFAPGSRILSVGIKSDSATAALDGTSMASPHVAGAIALLLEQFPTATPAQISRLLSDRSSKNVVRDPRGSPNQMLFTQP